MAKIFTLTNYSLAAGAFIISAASMGGGVSTDITYVDVDPDIVLDPSIVGPDEVDTETAFIDLDGDGVNDVSMQAQFVNWVTSWFYLPVMENKIWAEPLGNVELGIDTDPVPGTLNNWEYPFAYAMGSLLDESLYWCGNGAGCDDPFIQGLVCEYDIDDFDTRGADWLGAKYKYVAVRVNEGGNSYYGWIRLSIDNIADKVIIHDYAISNEPNTPIIAGERGDCYPPSVENITSVTATSAKVKWAPVYEASTYKLRYRPVGSSTWTYKTATAGSTSKNLTPLTCDTEYEWQIRVLCSDGTASAYSNMHTFATASCKIGGTTGGAEEITIYPNPASEYIMIEGFDMLPAKVQVLSIGGIVHYDKNIDTDEPLRLEVADWNSGTYIIKISTDLGDITKKFTVMK